MKCPYCGLPLNDTMEKCPKCKAAVVKIKKPTKKGGKKDA